MRSAAAASRAVLAAAAIPSVRSSTPALIRVRCSSSAAPSVAVATSSPPLPTTITTFDHNAFIEDIAATKAPENLQCLMKVLEARGDAIISPGAKDGLIPLVVPLSESLSGTVTCLLRWPTAPPGMEMPVVEVRKHGLWLLAKNVDQYIHKLLVEADADDSKEGIDKLLDAASDFGMKLYLKGDLRDSNVTDLDVYLLKKVGLFPDVIERKALRHFEKGDHVSALITGEFYARNHFPGFGRPFVFNAMTLLKVGRKSEAKDAARGALKSPWWTLGCQYQEVAEIAEWEDEQIEFVREKVSEEGKFEDLKKGKAPEQVALDEAAFRMDLASVDGSWDDAVDRIAECYAEAGLHDIARFIKYRE